MSIILENTPTISVVICTRNEAANLQHVLPKIPDWIHEVLLVDGHSTDSTVEIAKQIRPEIKVLFQPGKGKGDAIKHGVEQAAGDIVVTLDADGQTNPVDIERFIAPLYQGYDLAKGTRLSKGRPPYMSMHRWIGNKILTITSNILFGTEYTDICSGYNAFWKQAFLRLELTKNGFELEQEMNVKARKKGLKVVEVEYKDNHRLGNSSKVSGFKQGFIDLWVIVRERFLR